VPTSDICMLVDGPSWEELKLGNSSARISYVQPLHFTQPLVNFRAETF